MGRPKGNPLEFAVDDQVRYKPGLGTYGYETAVERDGRIPATVIGHTVTMVRLRFVIPKTTVLRERIITRPVAADSLAKVQGPAHA